MAQQVQKLYEPGIVDASFIGLDATPVAANTKQNNPKSFAADKFKPENHPKADQDCALGVHSASNQHNERRYEFYWGYKNHVLVDCISGLPLYELTTPANVADSAVVQEILAAANLTLPLWECTFLGDKGYDANAVYHLVKDVYEGDAVIPLNPRNTKDPKKLAVGNPVCNAGLAMHKDGKTTNNGRTRQKFCCPFRQSKTGECPCNHKNWNNGKKNRGCTKYKTIPTDYRLSIDRSCSYFKRTYALRSECERYNSRFKASGQERLWIRNGTCAANLNSLAHISALAVALAAVLSGSHSSTALPSPFGVPLDGYENTPFFARFPFGPAFLCPFFKSTVYSALLSLAPFSFRACFAHLPQISKVVFNRPYFAIRCFTSAP